MSNLTIAVDEEVVKLARVRAIQEGTSVSAQLRQFLAAYASGASTAVPPYAETAKTLASAAAPLPEWLQQIRARVAEFGGIEAAEWLPRRAQASGREPVPFPD